MMGATVCSGIGAPETAMPHWQWQFCAEIEPFPSAVLAHHYPHVPNRGDMTRFKEWPDAAIDVLVGGTPCQSFSVAGLRKGLDDPRGNLALVFLALADRYRPEWVVWENVPGVLSSSGGRDFGAFLGGLGELGYGWAYRCLDAQWFGLAQRRKRVFVVGRLGDWRRAAAVLFEPEGLRGDSAPSRTEGQGVAGTIEGGAHPCSYNGQDAHNDKLIAHCLRGEGFDASEDGTGRGTPLVPVPIDMRQASRGEKITNNRPEGTSGGAPGHGIGDAGDPAFTVSERGQAIAFSCKDHGADAITNLSPTLCREPGGPGSQDWAQHAAVVSTTETVYGVSHADASKTGPDQALRALRQAVGEEAYSEWGIGVVAALRQAEVLRSEVHGGGVRCSPDNGHKLDDDALSCAEDRPGWTVQQVWQAGCAGCPPQGWRPPEQLARELGSHLSQLPQQRASAARFLLGLWRTSEGLGLLRQALSAVQEVWRPAPDEGEPAPAPFAVRRLTPREAERLQGFPDDFTAIPYRGKPASDGPRYKALGNSMAVPVLQWILRRIELAHAVTEHLEAAE